nr:hypothetical protein FJN17_12955 [Bradyrhizobium symbiodeficiens]
MRRILIPASLAGLLVAAGISEANAWVRSGSVTTRRGTYYGSASGGCGGGSCWRSGSITGPYGGTLSRSGNVTRVGPNAYNYSQTVTGPNGRSVTREGTVHPHYRY